MNREEEILKASPYIGKGVNKAFADGANWADEHPQTITDMANPRVGFDGIPDGAILTFGKSKMITNSLSNAMLIRDIIIADNEDRTYIQPISDEMIKKIANIAMFNYDCRFDGEVVEFIKKHLNYGETK